MAFKTGDFKKTMRKSGDERVLYPYQIRDDRFTASLSFAIDYYERAVKAKEKPISSVAFTVACSWTLNVKRPLENRLKPPASTVRI